MFAFDKPVNVLFPVFIVVAVFAQNFLQFYKAFAFTNLFIYINCISFVLLDFNIEIHFTKTNDVSTP